MRLLVGGALVSLLAGCGGGGSVAVTSTAPQGEAGGPTAVATLRPTPQATDRPIPTGSLSSGTSISTKPTPTDWPASATPAPVAGAKLVVPRPGMLDVHPMPWAYVEQRSADVIRVYYYAGVEPCVVLDSVKVEYLKDTIAVSLFTGSDPAQQNRVCMALARATAVDVTLTDPPTGRTFIDGSTGKAPTATTKPQGM